MKYSSFKLFEYIIVLILVVAYVIEYCISNHFSKPGWLYIVIGTFVILSALLFVTEHIANKKYPQWENLWRMPSSIIALLAAVFAATIIIAAFFNISSGWYLFLLVLLRVSPDYYYAKKYELDTFHSVEELLEKHPEAKGKIRKTFFEN